MNALKRMDDGAPFALVAYAALRSGLVVAIVAVGLIGCRSGEPAVARGDALWADSSYMEALAEYRLAARQGGDEAALARVAHAYGRVGQFEAMRDSYDRLLERAPEFVDQAVYDYLDLAQRAQRRGDRYGMAGAVEAALMLKPDAAVSELAVPLARYHADTGSPERALEYFERAFVVAQPDSALDLLYEIGLVHEKEGNCRDAIGFFSAYERRAVNGRHATDNRWHMGTCAFELGREARQAGQPTRALTYLGLVLELGVPESVQDRAWFERGEVLFALGRSDEAEFAYRRVLQLNPARTGQLVQQAERRINQIRFGF